MSGEEAVPNERLRRARSLKGWSQADLAAKVGTSFEIVSRWERGVAVPGPYYRERLCAALGKTAEELGLRGDAAGAITLPSLPLVLLVSSHVDAEKPTVAHLKTLLQDQGITLWSSRQLGRQGRENPRAALRAAIQSALVMLVILSPEARTSRHVKESLALASRYQLPIYGIWIEGERWQEYLPEGSSELVGVTDARASNVALFVGEITSTLAQAGLTPSDNSSTVTADPPPAPAAPSPAEVPLLPTLPGARRWRGIPRRKEWLLMGLAAMLIAVAAMGSASVLEHLGESSPVVRPVRGGTWIEDILNPPIESLIPNGPSGGELIDQALYLPLFYGDVRGFVHPGAAAEVPTLKNGGISADGETWTIHMRPHLVWSDGQPYDARDVDYTWRLWLNPTFQATNDGDGLDYIHSAKVSSDNLTITFHLLKPYAPFLQSWVDGFLAPLPAHLFSLFTPSAILQSSENLNPTVTSGPFVLAESAPNDHFTLARNPRYYLASQGLPYLDGVIFRVAKKESTITSDLQAGSITSTWGFDLDQLPAYQHLTSYMLVPAPTSATFEALFFDFHNTILATHLEVRQAIAMAIDQQTLIKKARQGFATPLCTDHPSAMHPGYEPGSPSGCPRFDLTAANNLLQAYGWVKGADGVRANNGQRLEFEYSTTTNLTWRNTTETILQQDFLAIGIKLDIQNYNYSKFFFSLLPEGDASPPTGALAGRYDIAELSWSYDTYDPDDSFLLRCNSVPPNGANVTFFCDPNLDSIYDQELTTVEPGIRQKLFELIHTVYLTNYPFIVLYSPTNLAIVRKGTHNYQPSPFEGSTINIWQWWCDHGKC